MLVCYEKDKTEAGVNLMMQKRAVCKDMCRIISSARADGFMCSGGNLSVRCNENEFFVTPHACIRKKQGRLKTSDICTFSVEGTNLSPKQKPSVEALVHAKIYSTYPTIQTVFHAHTPYILSFVSDNEDIEASFYNRVKKYGQPIIANNPLSCSYSDINLSDYGLIIIVPEHGVFVGSYSLEEAYYLTCKYNDLAKYLLGRRVYNFLNNEK